MLTSSLLPGRRALVASLGRITPAPVSESRGAELAAAVERVVARLGEDSLVGGLRVEAVAGLDAGVPSTAPITTVQQAVTAGKIRVVAGNRLDRSHLTSEGTGRAVLGAPEILGESEVGTRRIDLLTFAAAYAAGRLTEPGDVVLCSGPRVGALVDEAGGSVVEAPARVLRITEAGRRHLLPDMLAADLRAIAPGDRDWRRASLRTIPGGVDMALTDTYGAIELERGWLLAKISDLDELRAAVTDGVASGSLTITRPPAIRLQTPPTEGQ